MNSPYFANAKRWTPLNLNSKHLKSIILIVLVYFSFQAYGQNTSKKTDFDYADYLESQNKKCIGKDFPVFKVNNSDSTYFSNLDFAGQIVFINFWFEECAPCIAELDGLNKMFDNLKNQKKILFVSFTFDDQETINRTRKKYNINYKIVHIDKTECYRLNFNSGFPTSFILDRKSKIVSLKNGCQTDKAIASQTILSEIYPIILEQLYP